MSERPAGGLESMPPSVRLFFWLSAVIVAYWGLEQVVLWVRTEQPVICWASPCIITIRSRRSI